MDNTLTVYLIKIAAIGHIAPEKSRLLLSSETACGMRLIIRPDYLTAATAPA
jgi:hypothetical protein